MTSEMSIQMNNSQLIDRGLHVLHWAVAPLINPEAAFVLREARNHWRPCLSFLGRLDVEEGRSFRFLRLLSPRWRFTKPRTPQKAGWFIALMHRSSHVAV